MQAKACVFVDGENLRHSLMRVFSQESREWLGHYVPSSAAWSDFFDWIVREATGGTHCRLRAYWFVVEHLDCTPHNVQELTRCRNPHRLRAALTRHKPFAERLNKLTGEDLGNGMQQMLDELSTTQRAIESRFAGWRSEQNRIALRHRAVEFRRAGAISFNLFERRFGREKAVDVKLACDMIMLRDIYDTAIIVSGDQDYAPAAQVLKDAGKTVVNVAFEKRNGDLLPGGARRLNIVTDASLNVPYPKLRELMGLESAPTELAA